MKAGIVNSAVILLLGCLLAVSACAQSPADSATEMVLIPAGEFTMGQAESETYPTHQVKLSAFYMDKTEVTNAQYLKFCQETERKMPIFWGLERFRSSEEYPNMPVVGVSNSDAKSYAEWVGKRLPTEAEWEYAARGGLEGKRLDLGDEITPEEANYNKSKNDGPVEVGSYRPNGYQLHDMIGNVREWVSDWYAEDYYQNSPHENPQGPEKTRFKVLRGAGWHTGPGCLAVYSRWGMHSGWGDFNVGFRCAKSVETK